MEAFRRLELQPPWVSASSRQQEGLAQSKTKKMVKGFLKPSAGAGTTQKILQDHPDDSSFENSMVRKKGGSGLPQSKTKKNKDSVRNLETHPTHIHIYTPFFLDTYTYTHTHIHTYTYTREISLPRTASGVQVE